MKTLFLLLGAAALSFSVGAALNGDTPASLWGLGVGITLFTAWWVVDKRTLR
jgi:hypothetical protein